MDQWLRFGLGKSWWDWVCVRGVCVCLGCGGVGGVGGEWIRGWVLGWGKCGDVFVVNLDSLCRWQVHVSVYCAWWIPAHLRCTQC